MQTTSVNWNNIIGQGKRDINQGVFISWMRTIGSGVKFFTINQSTIGGTDIIKGGGSAVTFFDKYNYVDYSRFCLSWSVQRNIGQYPYGVYMAQADIELDNTSKRFTPNFDPTIGSGILPNRPVKISVGFNGESLKQFVGFSQNPENTLNNRVTSLHCYDALDYMNGFVSTASGSQTSKYAHEIMAALLLEAGFSASQYVLDTSLNQTIGYVATNGQKAGDIFQKLCEAEQGSMFVDENGTIRFWNRQHFTTISGTQQFALTYSKMADIKFQNTVILNDVIVVAKPRAVAAKQKIWELSSAITLLPGQSLDYFADFTDDTGPLPVTSVDIPLYIDSATTSYYTTNDQSDGSGAAQAGLVIVTGAYSFGNSYRVTFKNNHSSVMYVTTMGIYATPAKVTSIITQEYKDPDSIATWGLNPGNNGVPLTIENDYIQNSSDAYDLAFTLVKQYKDPKKRFVVPVAVGSNPAWQIGDAGTLTIADTLQTKNVYITGIKTSMNRMADFKMELELEERLIKRYFQINQSKINGTDTIAP